MSSLSISPRSSLSGIFSGLPRPDKAKWEFWEALANLEGYNQLNPSGFWEFVNSQGSGGNAGAAATYNNAGAGAGASFTLTAQANQAVFSGASWITMLRNWKVLGTIGYGAASNNAAGLYLIGLSDYYDNPIANNNVVGIAVQKVAASANPNFVLLSQYNATPGGVASTITTTDTGIPVVNNQRYKFELDFNALLGSLTLFINGIKVATQTPASLPVGPLALTWCAAFGGTANSSFSGEYLYAEQSTV